MKAYSKKHPNKKWSECLKEAKKTYERKYRALGTLHVESKKQLYCIMTHWENKELYTHKKQAVVADIVKEKQENGTIWKFDNVNFSVFKLYFEKERQTVEGVFPFLFETYKDLEGLKNESGIGDKFTHHKIHGQSHYLFDFQIINT